MDLDPREYVERLFRQLSPKEQKIVGEMVQDSQQQIDAHRWKRRLSEPDRRFLRSIQILPD